MSQPRMKQREGSIQRASRTKQVGNHLIERQRSRQWRIRLRIAHVDAAAVPALYPKIALQQLVAGTHRIRMEPKAPRHLACARQTLAGRKLPAQYAQNHLRHEL